MRSGWSIFLAESASIVFAISLFACERPPPPQTAPAGPNPQAFVAQADRGQLLYASRCGQCHGARGEGGSAPLVVGRGSLERFHAASDLSHFLETHTQAGKTPHPDTLAIVAYEMQANGILIDAALDDPTAAQVDLTR